MFNEKYKKLLTEYKRSLKESETRKTISIFAYEKYYNKKLDDLYENIINLKKSKQMKYEYINKDKLNLDKKISLFESCINNDIEDFSNSIDLAYNRLLEQTKAKTNEIYLQYEKSVDTYSLTFENTLERLEKEIEHISKKSDEESLKKIKKFELSIDIEKNNLKSLQKRLENLKKENKDSYLVKNIAINNKVRQTRNAFLNIEKNDSEKYNTLIGQCDNEVDAAKSELFVKNKNIIKDFNNNLNRIDNTHKNNYNSKLVELSVTYEKRIEEIKKDKETDLAKLENNYKIKGIRDKSEELRLELDALKKKRKIEERLINIDYENELDIIDIERAYIDSYNEANINLDISLKVDEINVLNAQRNFLQYKENTLKEFNINKILARKEEISISNMLKCENEKITRDCSIDVEYQKLSASKLNFELQKTIFENEKYIEYLEFCKLINLKNFSNLKDYYIDYHSSDSLIALYERNIENAKSNYASFQVEKLVSQRVSNLNSEKEFITNVIKLLLEDIDNNPKAFRAIKKVLNSFVLSKEKEIDDISSQKLQFKKKNQDELKGYGYNRKDKIEKLRLLEEKMNLLDSDITKLLSHIVYYENEITGLNKTLKNKTGNVDDLKNQLIDSTSLYNEYKSKYIKALDDKKRLNKTISDLSKDIEYLTKKIETAKSKITSKGISEELLNKTTIYDEELNKLNHILDNELDMEELKTSILEGLDLLYEKLLGYQKKLLAINSKNLKAAIKSNQEKYLKVMTPINKELTRNINDLTKNRTDFLNYYTKSLNEYKRSISKNTHDTKYNIRIIYENIRQRRIKMRNDLLAFKNNAFELRRTYELDLKNDYNNVLLSIKEKERELIKMIKNTNNSKKVYHEKNKNTLKEIYYSKNSKLKDASANLKDKKAYNYNSLKELDNESDKRHKEFNYRKKESEIDFKMLLKKNESFYNDEYTDVTKEYIRSRKRAAK